MTKTFAIIEPTGPAFGSVHSRYRSRDRAVERQARLDGWFRKTYLVRRLRVMAEVGEVVRYNTLPED